MAGTAKKKSASKKAVKHAPRKAAAKSGSARAKKSAPARRSTKSAPLKTRAVKKSSVPAAEPAARPERNIPAITRQMVAAAVAACEDKKAEDTRILELDASDAGFTDFFLITSGTNERQTQSIADEVEFRMKHDFGTYANSVEGKRQGEWILLDYVDFVVHIFLAERRAFYDIERLRKSARTVDLAELRSTLREKTASSRKRVAAKESRANTK